VDPQQPETFKFPFRAGYAYASYLIRSSRALDGSELQLSLGTGFRFTANRGSVDFAIERAWRDDDAGLKEKSFMFTFGVGIRTVNVSRKPSA
jgi:hypothetical protein